MSFGFENMMLYHSENFLPFVEARGGYIPVLSELITTGIGISLILGGIYQLYELLVRTDRQWGALFLGPFLIIVGIFVICATYERWLWPR